jgi:hypothetical protein
MKTSTDEQNNINKNVLLVFLCLSVDGLIGVALSVC